MKEGVQLELCRLPLDRLQADIAVAGFFSDDRPLRGGAGRLDWRLCGQLSELLATGKFAGEPGSAALLPGSGPIAACRVLLMGLGPRKKYTLRRSQETMREAVRRCLDLGLHRMALAPLGIAPDDLGRHAPALVSGLSQAVRSFEAAAEDEPNDLLVRLALNTQQWQDATEILPALVAQTEEPLIRLVGDAVRGQRGAGRRDIAG